MYYDRNQLAKDIKMIVSRYGKSRQEGFYTVYSLFRGPLAILPQDPLNDVCTVMFAGVQLDIENLPMNHPATEYILQLAIESDEYWSGLVI